MRRRRFLAAASAALAAPSAAALLGGCAGSGDDGTLDYLSLAWQKESMEANKALVAEWNKRNPNRKVRYVQGSWDTVHDQLLTSFEGGEAPDIIHDEANDLTDFAHGGYLADLRGLLPAGLKQQIPQRSWDMATFPDDGVYGVPFVQEPRVLIANRKLLDQAGIRAPEPERPWSWPEFEEAAKELRGGRTFGVAWSMKEPVNQSVNLSLTTGGAVFYQEDGKNVVRFDEADSYVSEVIHRQVNKTRTAPEGSLGMGGSDTLPGFFSGRYAMVPLNFSFRQQVQQQAPDGFEWVTLPMPAGRGGGAGTDAGGGSGTGRAAVQGVSPQTLSIAQDTERKEDAMAFIAFMTRPDHMARLAKGDWMVPTGTEALRDPELNTARHGWRTGVHMSSDLRASPVLGVRGYAEWMDKIATPAFQEFYSGGIGLGELRDKLVEDGNRILARYQR
ncbi:extracellular solute-binding protein [Streptomyces armeniacus]|uniref:Extracellular solute-binding protein n=1 Tax=Streptomyces armeniacus TaxID=83291 RepID=A0A345XXW9_9ACTN|nr:extracellular solute-binding protein [Streptomyces armeniacus]AXK36485.1 extracellular solute-binding protein [Streptomyces armeniacus]